MGSILFPSPDDPKQWWKSSVCGLCTPTLDIAHGFGQLRRRNMRRVKYVAVSSSLLMQVPCMNP